jgi:hypothetical protein
MTLVTPSQSNPNDEITAARINDPVNQLAAVLNGQIDDANISGVSGSKLATGTVPGTAITDASVTYAKLLATIFSGAVTSFTNSGTAGGTFYHINLGGIKLLWGRTNGMGSSTSGGSGTVVFPTGFFSTIQVCNATTNSITNSVQQFCIVNTLSATGCTITPVSVSGASTTQVVSVLVIGT